MQITNKSFEQLMTEVKHNIIDEAYITVLVMTVPLLYSLYKVRTVGHLDLTILMVFLFFCAFLTLFLIRNHINYDLRAGILIIASLFFGTNAFLSWGLASPGSLLLLLGCTFVALYTNVRNTKIFFVICVSIYVVMGFLLVNNLISLRVDLSQIQKSSYIWFVLICVYALILALILRSIHSLYRFMNAFVEELQEQNSTINTLAYYDQLTGLPNRLLFHEQMEEAIKRACDKESNFTLAYFDIDDFKKINNILGHQIGDQIIRSTCKRLLLNLPKDTIFARMGGDEFAILYTGDDNALVAKEIYGYIEDAFVQTSKAHDAIYHFSSSVGFTSFPKDGRDYEELLKNADIALFEAKSQGKNCYVIFDSAIRQHMDERIEMEGYLEIAFNNGELCAYYQPKVDAHTGQIIGFEALARWPSTHYGFVSPDRFIPILEDTGMIIAFGRLIMREALIQLKEWHIKGYEGLTMAVNVSALQFSQLDFSQDVYALLEELDLDPKYLEIEITESLLINDFNPVYTTLAEFSTKGISVALDDFGTGYSSLTYLSNLPISTLKIDRSFISGVNGNEVLLPTIIELAHNLNLKVVAEGIETPFHEAYLIANDCDYLQGFYYSKPVPSKAIPPILESMNYHHIGSTETSFI